MKTDFIIYLDGKFDIKINFDSQTSLTIDQNGSVKNALIDGYRDYWSSGNLKIADIYNFYYWSAGQLKTVENLYLDYWSSGLLKKMNNMNFDYWSSGCIKSINNIQFDYWSSGKLKSGRMTIQSGELTLFINE